MFLEEGPRLGVGVGFGAGAGLAVEMHVEPHGVEDAEEDREGQAEDPGEVPHELLSFSLVLVEVALAGVDVFGPDDMAQFMESPCGISKDEGKHR